MADLSITVANVAARGGAKFGDGTAGATIAAGQVLYLDPTDGKYKLADSNSATAAVRSPAGIALHAALNGQPIKFQKSGPITIGATLLAGAIYALSETPGGIQPAADLGSGEYSTVLGVAQSTTVLDLDFQESGAALA